MVQLVAQDNRN